MPSPPWSTLGHARGAQRGAVVDVKPVLPKKVVTNKYVCAIIPWLGKASYILLAGGFLMTDVLWLRGLLTGGYIGLTTYHLFQYRPLHIPMIGSFIFICANAYMGLYVFHERFMSLDEEERTIFNDHFKPTMSEQAFRKLLAHSQVLRVEAQFQVVRCSSADLVFDEVTQELFHVGEIADLVLVLEGQVELVRRDGESTFVGPGTLLGEVSFLGRGKAWTTALAVPGSKYVIWRQEELNAVLEQEPEVKKGLMLRLGQEMMRKVISGEWRVEQGSANSFDPPIQRAA